MELLKKNKKVILVSFCILAFGILLILIGKDGANRDNKEISDLFYSVIFHQIHDTLKSENINSDLIVKLDEVLPERFNTATSKDIDKEQKILSSHVIEELGYFLIASLFVHFIYHYFLKNEADDNVKKHSKDLLNKTEDIINNIFTSSIKYGFSKIHKKSCIEDMLKSLDAGDELLWFDTFYRGIDSIRDNLTEALDKGVKIKFLIMDQHSKFVKYRSKEILDKGQYEYESYNAAMEYLLNNLMSIRKIYPELVEIREYCDLICVPFYIHLRGGRTIKAIQGFYLSDPFEKFIHIEWRQDNDSNSKILNSFKSYFDKKWKEWELKDVSLVSGLWKYYSVSGEEDNNLQNHGVCTVQQFGRTLIFNGERQCESKGDVRLDYMEHYHVKMKWDSTWVEICEDNIIRGDYNVHPIETKDEIIPAFFKLHITEYSEDITRGAKKALKMEGDYYLSKNLSDRSCNIRYGKIFFSKES